MEKTPVLPRPWSTWLVFLSFVVAMLNSSSLVVGFRLFGNLRDFVVETGLAFWVSGIQLLAAIAVLFLLIVEPGSSVRSRAILIWILPVAWLGQGLSLVSFALRVRYEHEITAPVLAGGAIALLYVVLAGKAWSQLLRLTLIDRAEGT
jgi:hypothetical protein